MSVRKNLVIATSDPFKFRDISLFFTGHNITADHMVIEKLPFRGSLSEDAAAKAKYAQALLQKKGYSPCLVTESHSDSASVLFLAEGTDAIIFEGSGLHARLEALSKYIISHHRYSLSSLSCRDDAQMLGQYVKDGSPSFDTSPIDWINGNKLFRLFENSLYQKLVNFVLNEHGMFLKVWELNCQKNYWNSTFNGGIPITKKREELHEGIFFLHDIFHFLFPDPLITGEETPEEARAYIVHRMMSEACTQVLADMLGVAHAKLDERGYDTDARRIFRLFKSAGLDAYKFETLLRLMYANCAYCLLGDDAAYRELGVNDDALESFKEKYGIYFSVDFQWNAQNIAHMLSSSRGYDRIAYTSILPESIRKFTVKSLFKNVKTEDGKMSFESLFAFFANKIIAVAQYEQQFSPLLYAKQGTVRYLSGQMIVAFRYLDQRGAKQLIAFLQEKINLIQYASSAEKVVRYYRICVSSINGFIDQLADCKLLLPHEVMLYKLHVPHFPAIYYSYDLPKTRYGSLHSVSEQILNHAVIFRSNVNSIADILSFPYQIDLSAKDI